MKRYLYSVTVFIALLIMASCSWAGYYDDGHTGLTEDDPFLIKSRNDFIEFRDRINAGSDPQGAYYKLDTTSKTISLAKNYENWTPLGTSYRPFTGHLDGNGHKITVNFDYFTLKEAALFGTVKTESGYAVKNLNVATSSSGHIKGELAAGIVLNLYNASIEDCTFSGTLLASTSTGDYGANTVAAGGIVQHMYSGTVKNCTVENATISISPRIYILSHNYAGGIAAIMESGTIEGCTVSEGTVFDGAEGLLIGNSAANVTTGGIVGRIVSGKVIDNKAYISVNYEDAKNLYLGGIIGEIYDEDYYIDNNIYSGVGYGIGSDIDGEPSDEPGCSKIGAGTEDEPIIIDSITAFTDFYEKVNADMLYAGDMYYKLAIDLDISELNCKPIGTEQNPFTGHFDGDGHTIITDNDAALFGTVKTASGYAVKNLHVVGNVKGRFSAGIALNLYNASIENCTFTGNVRGYVGSDPDLEEMDAYAGGIVSHLYSGTIKDCTVFNAVITSAPYHILGSSGYAGGIAGFVEGGRIENCTVSGDVVIDGLPDKSFFEGHSSSAANIKAGGILGLISAGTVKNNASYAEIHGWSTTGTVHVGGVIGEITGSMSRVSISGNTFILKGETKSAGIHANTLLPRYGIGCNTAGNGKGSDSPGCENIGSGTTEDNPIIIASVSAMERLRNNVNAGVNIEDLYYRLDADIEFGAWTAIGNDSFAFTGHFNGNNHTITITGSSLTGGSSLFWSINTADEYAVKNLNISGSFKGQYAAGLTINLLGGTIENCTFTGKIIAYSPSDNYVDETPASVRTTYAGGIAALVSSGTIKDCTVKDSFIISNPYFLGTGYAGGIAAKVSGGSIESCCVPDDVIIAGISQHSIEALIAGHFATIYAGGITGFFTGGTLKDNEAYAAVHGWTMSMAYLGGIIGKFEPEASSSYAAENNKYLAVAEFIELDSESENNPVMYLPSEDMRKLIISQHENTITAEIGIGASLEGTASDSPGCVNLSPGYGVSEDNPRVIDSLAALERMRTRVNTGIDPENAYYLLSTDLLIMDESIVRGWESIGTGEHPFTGHFDGGGHTIEIHTNRSGIKTAGLFGTLKTENEKYAVKNLTVTGEIEGHSAGGIALNLYNGSIEDCVFSGRLAAHAAHADDDNAYAGGIVEHMYSGTVKNCLIEEAEITVKPYYTFINAFGYAGGIAARMDGGTVEGCVVDEESVVIAVPHDVSNFLASFGRPEIKAGGIAGVLTDGTVKNNEVYGSVQGLGGTVYVGAVIGIIEPGLESSISVEGNRYRAEGKTTKVGDFSTQPAEFGIGTGTDEPGCIDADKQPGGDPDTQAKPAFKRANLILSGQIGVNFFLDLPAISGVDYYNGNSCYMAFDINGNSTANNPQPTDGSFKQENYFGYRCYVNSVQMADPITADFHYGNGKTVSYVYTVKRYLDNKITGSKDEAMRKLAAAIKNYGHYAQIYLSRINGWKIGEKHVELEAASDYTASDIEEVRQIAPQYKPVLDDFSDTGITGVQYNLELAAETTINLTLKMDSDYSGSVFASLNGGRENMAVRQSDGTYRVQIAGISAHRLGDTQTVKVTAAKDFTVKVSALTFVYNSLRNTSTAEDRQKLAAALYKYYTSTMEYKNANQ